MTRSTVHRVRPGDSLWSVARRYGTTPDRLASANGIRETATLSLGQPLRVPGRPGTSQQAGVATAAARPLSGSFDTIRIRGGDTLWSLSRRYGTTPAKIAALNGIREDATLQLNQAVKVPAVSRNEPAAKTPAVGSSSQDKRTANSAASQTQTAQIAAVRPERRATTASSRGSLISGIARRFLGTPYLWGGTGNGGFDCSGFIYSMYNRMGVRLPRTSFAMFNVGRSVPRSALRPGDLVFFTTYAPGASHAGIYIGGGSFVHASSAGRGVRIDALSKSYYNARFLGARRHL